MRFLWCLAFWALFPSLAAAQNQLGARLGLNVATVTGDFAFSDAAEVRYGFVGGFSLAFPLRYSFALQTEVLYAQKGFSPDEAAISDLSGTPVSVTSATFELTTLDVPLLLTYTVPLSRDVSFRPYTGFYFSFELAERLRVEPAIEAIPVESNSFTSTDLGWALGLDVTLAFQSLQPTLGVRFTRSLSNQLEEDAGSSPDATAYNAVLSIFMGIRL